MRCLPNDSNVMTLKEAHEAINKLCESQLFNVSSMSAQAELKTVRLWFDKLVADRPPHDFVAYSVLCVLGKVCHLDHQCEDRAD
eukprot:5016267-Amphidinium_carterae.1